MRAIVLGAVVGSIAALSVPSANADPVADFYAGKIYNVYTGTGENSTGAVAQYARAIADVIGDHIPGHPTVVFRAMPGAGGIKAANFIYAVAPQDGTVEGFISRGFIIQPMFNKQAKFDASKLNWIGSAATEVSVGAVWTAGTGVRSIQDAMKEQVVVGGTAPSQDTGLFPVVLNKLIGTKFKVITGYKSSSEVDLAMEKGEVKGKIGWTWGSLNSGPTVNWVKDGKVKVIIQMGLEQSPNVPSDVPLLLDLAKNSEDKQLMQLIFGPAATGYPSFMGPGVPQDRVAAIRKAYSDTLADPEFRRRIAQQKLEIDPIPGATVAKIVDRIYATPASVVRRARDLMPKS